MGAAQIHGSLWGQRARDYAQLVEPLFQPVYERVFHDACVRKGSALLDVGCGPGLAAQIAAGRGARVSGIDAAEASLVIARERTPVGDFRAGEMEKLPWSDATFDVVTGFNAFQFATTPVDALCEARRVTKVGGRVALAIWGPDEEVDLAVTMAAIRRLLPSPPKVEALVPFSAPGRLEALLEEAGLTTMVSGTVDCPFIFPDMDTAVRAIMSSGGAVAAVQRLGAEAVQQAIADSLLAFRTSQGGCYQHNRLRYVIARSDLVDEVQPTSTKQAVR